MSDLLETPSLARYYCPGCEPATDPLVEILESRWCNQHEPPRDGTADGQVVTSAYLSGSAEAGGEDNRAFCDVIHQGRKR